ncbi:MAG: hypothetical protein H8F28_28195, partial [Fibrella sp.]|nr:hypothetical protein [Armatimonadota bacterium]
MLSRFALICTGLFCALFQVGCQPREETSFPPKLPPATPIAMHPLAKSAIVSGNTAFGIALLQELAPNLKPDENLFLSPYSVSQAVLLAANGSQGEMQAGLLRVLALDTTHLDTINGDSQS